MRKNGKLHGKELSMAKEGLPSYILSFPEIKVHRVRKWEDRVDMLPGFVPNLQTNHEHRFEH